MKETVGDVEVPLYDSSKADPSAPINVLLTKNEICRLYRAHQKYAYRFKNFSYLTL